MNTYEAIEAEAKRRVADGIWSSYWVEPRPDKRTSYVRGVRPCGCSHYYEVTDLLVVGSATIRAAFESAMSNEPYHTDVCDAHRGAVSQCCGRPMRLTGMGSGPYRPAYICSACERYRGPLGAWTPEQWWRSAGDGQCAWMHAQGEAYAGGAPSIESIARPATGEQLAREFAEFKSMPDDSPLNAWPMHIEGSRVEELGKQLADAVTAKLRELEQERQAADARMSNPAGAQPLIDGLTIEQCLDHWEENRAALRMRIDLVYELTPDQIAAGRLAYRDRVAASEHRRERWRQLDEVNKASAVSVIYGEVDADD